MIQLKTEELFINNIPLHFIPFIQYTLYNSMTVCTINQLGCWKFKPSKVWFVFPLNFEDRNQSYDITNLYIPIKY